MAMTSAEKQRQYVERHPERVAASLRRYAECHSERIAGNQRLYAERNPDKVLAHRAVRSATEVGVLVRPNACLACGKACKPEAHHVNYAKPLEIIWVCKRCHGIADDFRRDPTLASRLSSLENRIKSLEAQKNSTRPDAEYRSQ
jgi:hypothetical protein